MVSFIQILTKIVYALIPHACYMPHQFDFCIILILFARNATAEAPCAVLPVTHIFTSHNVALPTPKIGLDSVA